MLTMYHNPRCSKSRKTLEILKENGAEPVIVEYLKEPPAGSQVQRLAELLGLSVAELLRRGEDDFKQATDLPDLTDNVALADWVAQHPKTLERPIVVDDAHQRAVIGRPPENVLELLGR